MYYKHGEAHKNLKEDKQTKENKEPELQSSLGFNCEQHVGEQKSFNLWDISGQEELI